MSTEMKKLLSLFKRKGKVQKPETKDEKELQQIIDDYARKWHGKKKTPSELFNL